MLVKSQIKYIQTLGDKKHRDKDGVFIAEGPKLIKELLEEKNVPLVSLFAVSDWVESHHSKIPSKQVTEISESELERISFLTTPNEVLGIFRKPVFAEMNPGGKLSLVLDNIQDPGNLGTIVRIADWFGTEYIICSEDSVDVFNPKVVQASMGSVSRVQTLYTSIPAFLARHQDIPVYASVLDGENIFTMDRLNEGMIIIGNESRGIGKELLKISRHKITIPKRGKAESLNAAIAAGIILSQFLMSGSSPR